MNSLTLLSRFFFALALSLSLLCSKHALYNKRAVQKRHFPAGALNFKLPQLYLRRVKRELEQKKKQGERRRGKNGRKTSRIG